jgi:hypothetical protein
VIIINKFDSEIEHNSYVYYLIIEFYKSSDYIIKILNISKEAFKKIIDQHNGNISVRDNRAYFSVKSDANKVMEILYSISLMNKLISGG